jgi:hypothetical protein
MRVARPIFRFLLLGQNCLHHIAGLGDVRQVDLRGNRLACACGRAASVAAGTIAATKIRANLYGLIFFERARVSLPRSHAHLVQNVQNFAALSLYFARQIVDSNLTHPPLFSLLPKRPLVAHGYLMAMAALQSSVVFRSAFRNVAHITRHPL